MKDKIIQELWRIKDQLARAANYDIHALCRQLRQEELRSPARVVDRSSLRPAATSQKAPQ